MTKHELETIKIGTKVKNEEGSVFTVISIPNPGPFNRFYELRPQLGGISISIVEPYFLERYQIISDKAIHIPIPEGTYPVTIITETGELVVKFRKHGPVKSNSWNDFCKNHPELEGEYFINTYSEIVQVNQRNIREEDDRNVLATKEDAEGILAYIQLIRFHDEWVTGWDPNENDLGYEIFRNTSDFLGVTNSVSNKMLSFPTSEMANDFLETFRDLILTAKRFI